VVIGVGAVLGGVRDVLEACEGAGSSGARHSVVTLFAGKNAVCRNAEVA
jgi:hypothetical protein